MATPLDTQIINNVVTTISAITAGATYSRTVNVCERLTYIISETSEYDAVFIYDAGCTKSYLDSSVVECVQNVMLDCWAQDDDTAEAIDQLAADIEKALSVDITRGSLARDTQIRAITKTITEDQKPEANCTIEITIMYRHADGDPYTTA
jgi:hypothetical protein